MPGIQSLNQWFNQQAYASPAVNTFGTNPRNSLRGPDLLNFDFSLAKSWSIPGWESGKLQLRMDANNIFNHPAFSLPNSHAQSHRAALRDSFRQCRSDHRNRRRRSNDSALGPILVLNRDQQEEQNKIDRFSVRQGNIPCRTFCLPTSDSARRSKILLRSIHGCKAPGRVRGHGKPMIALTKRDKGKPL